MYSLTRRVLVNVFVALLLFLGITAYALDAIFRDLAERSLGELLDAQLVALVAAAETDPGGRLIGVSSAADARLANPGSGLYAQIGVRDGAVLWRSASLAGTFVDFGSHPGDAPTQRSRGFRFVEGAVDARLAVLDRAILWEAGRANAQQLLFSVATSLAPYEAQLRRFRQQLFGGFVFLSLLLLLTIALLLRRGLSPLRRLEQDIAAVESGARDALGTGYPRELAGVTENLNALLTSERQRIQRYRNTLGNLAHSLKTPLAVIRSTLSSHAAPESMQIVQQVERMREIVDHQLQRAATGGGPVIGQSPVDVRGVVMDLRGALLKVHARKDLSVAVDVAQGLCFIGDRADLTEALGNLMDNACKWCKGEVRVTAGAHPPDPPQRRGRIVIGIEDDGAGLPAELIETGPVRGRRVDESVPGHGLGLHMVAEMVQAYGGRLTLRHSVLGGASICLELPGRVV